MVEEYLIRVKHHLGKAYKLLDEASGWSIADIFLGGLFGLGVGIIKYSRIARARSEIEKAADILAQLKQHVKPPQINHSSLWVILDIGLDNMFIDLLKHWDISEAKRRIKEALDTVDEVLKNLKMKDAGIEEVSDG